MDLETAEPASTRRSLIGAAGLVGAAAVLVGASTASAAPQRPTDADRTGLQAAMRLELAAHDLCMEAAGHLDGADATLATVVAENHKAYAEKIAGAIGVAASGRDDGLFDELIELFRTSDSQAFARAARDLENSAVATHTELLGDYENLGAVELTASIITIESRQAAVFTSMAGFATNLDDMFGTGGAA